MNKLGIHRKCLKLVFVMITSNQIFDNRGCTDFWRVLKPEMEKMGTLKKNGDQMGTKKLILVPMGTKVPKWGPMWEQWGLLKLLQINRSGICHSCINDWVTQPLWIKDSMQLNFSSFIKWRDSIKISDRHNNVGSQFQRRRSKVKVIAKKLSYILQSSMFHNSPSQTALKSQWIGPSSKKLPP